MTNLTISLSNFVVESGPLGTAWFSPDKAYRYRLVRPLSDLPRTMVSIGQNPSKANHETNDMTITKDMEFARLHQCGTLVKINLGAFVTTDPHILRTVPDPIGPLNRQFIADAARQADIIVAAWGAMPNELWARFRHSVELIKAFNGVKCFGKTKSGAPRHTSRIGYASKLEDWRRP